MPKVNEMKNIKIVLLGVAVATMTLVGCNKSGEPAPAAQGGNAGAAAAAATSKVTDVPAESIKDFDYKVRETATWTGQACDLNIEGGASTLNATQVTPVNLDGFLISAQNGSVGNFNVVLKGADATYSIPATTDVERKDVVDFFKNENALQTGFRISTTLEKVKPGKYSVNYFYNDGKADYFCETGKSVVVN